MSSSTSRLDPALRMLLVCPQCRGELEEREHGLGCRACALLYPVVEGRPWMLPERAKKWREVEPGR